MRSSAFLAAELLASSARPPRGVAGTADRAVEGPCTDHRGPMASSTNSQLSAYDQISALLRLVSPRHGELGDSRLALDHQRELVKCDRHAPGHRRLDRQLVMPSTNARVTASCKLRRGTVAAGPTPVSTMRRPPPGRSALSQGHLPAGSRPAVSTRVHQCGGLPIHQARRGLLIAEPGRRRGGLCHTTHNPC
jgi:hypothetical protein